MRDRGWARVLLGWHWSGALLTAEISAARYFIRGERHEILCWAELRDVSGRRRAEIGSYRSVAEARAAAERDAALRCRREGVAERERKQGPAWDMTSHGRVDVRISRGRRSSSRGDSPASNGRPGKADKGRELGGGNYRPGDRDPVAALDAALAAFAGVIEEQG
jgi:hypothetical protein